MAHHGKRQFRAAFGQHQCPDRSRWLAPGSSPNK
jgi:hypothetical protein